jgi:TonB family protein
VAGSAGLFVVLLGLEPVLGVAGAGAAAGDWELAFHIAPGGESHRPTWLREAPGEISVTAPRVRGGKDGGKEEAEKRAAEAAGGNLVARAEPGTSTRSAGAARPAARLSGLTGLSGPESASSSGSGPGDERGYRRRTSVLEEAHRKGPVKLAPPPRRVTIKPVERSCPRPQYPAAAKKGDGKEGSVSVRVLISDTGEVSRWEVLSADPPGVFEKSVQDSIQVWKFSPALDQFGKPIESWRPYNFTFKFQDSR